MVKRYSFFLLLLLFAWSTGHAQSTKPAREKKDKKGILYMAFGSHRIFFTPSDISVNRSADPSFNFTLYNVKGRDEGGLKFKTAPQFSYTVGYYFTKKKFGIEYQYDHIKYFAKENQRVRLSGTINGQKFDKDTILHPGFFRLEHSDGGNYAMVNVVKWIPLTRIFKKAKNPPELMIKGGMGIVNPKTNSSVIGYYRDDKYHLSGYVAGFESGLRFHIGKYLFATGSFKGAYANYNDFLIAGGYGKQKWFSGQFNYLIGTQFPL